MTTPKLVTIGLPTWKRLKYLPHVLKKIEARDKANSLLGRTKFEAITPQSSARYMLHALTRLLARPYKQKRPPSKSVAILVLLSTRPTLTEDEKISVRHLEHYLGKYDRYLVGPPDSPIRLEGFRIKSFPGKFFGSVTAINHIMYAPLFFKAFEDYRYIFVYHLDSLVFSDQMEKWCKTDLDYIGAPWMQCPDYPWVTKPRVGNTGFGMMKVESALKVLYNRYRQDPGTYWLDMFTRNSQRVRPIVQLLRKLQPLFPRSKIVNSPVFEWDIMQDPGPNSRMSDLFWSDKAVSYLPEYKVASLEQGLEFAFEGGPRTCFEMNGGKMPFGCHAWARYDRSFWEPHLLRS